MPYQSFTDLLEQTLSWAEANEDEVGLLLAELVQEELRGVHIEPQTIFRAVAKAQARLIQALPEGTDLSSSASAAETFLSKADVMARRRA